MLNILCEHSHRLIFLKQQLDEDILARLKKIRGNITLACLINLCFSTTTLSIFVTCFKGKEIISWYDHAYMISNAIKINTHGLADTIIFII